MDAMTNLLTRRSIRSFKDEPIAPEVLDKILEAGTYAATGRNLQAPIIIAVTNKEMIARLSKMNAEIMGTSTDPFYGAPTLVIVLSDRSVRTYVHDGSLVLGNMMLAAHALGVGSCWIHRAKEEFDSPEGKEILASLGIEGDYEGVGHLILGYPAVEAPAARPRKENYIYRID